MSYRCDLVYGIGSIYLVIKSPASDKNEQTSNPLCSTLQISYIMNLLNVRGIGGFILECISAFSTYNH